MSESASKKLLSFPKSAFLLAIALVCLGLGISAAYIFSTLFAFRDKYLENSGHEIASSIDLRTRGPNRRLDIALWQEVLDDTLSRQPQRIVYILLTDQTGKVLAQAGKVGDEVSTTRETYVNRNGVSLFLFQESVPVLQHPESAIPSGQWTIHLGLYTAPASFITRQAYIYLMVVCLAILSMILLALYFLKMLRRFLALKAVEESQSRLASLGKMAATLAHEIRNPLGAMKGLSQVVQEELPKEHSTQPLLQTVITEAERLEQLVTDLLNFARFKAPLLQQFDLQNLLAEVIATLRANPDQTFPAIKLHTSEAAILMDSDEANVKQVLWNVISNAVEAAPHAESIQISVILDKRNAQAVIHIDDEGPGIGSQDPEELFQPFATTKLKGSGLGLAISRQLIEQLGGTITLGNRSLVGARCTIRLPLSAPQKQTAMPKVFALSRS
ncbi:MAG: ATP-binding protein [Acidobacteriota bacterium]